MKIKKETKMKTNQPLTFNQEKDYGVTVNQTTKAIDYKRLCAIEVQRSKELALATAAIREYEKELRAEVTYSKTGNTVTLQYDERVIKLVRNWSDLFDIKEKGKLIKRDLFQSVNDIRLLFALGEI
jgi:hypothetical protein